MAGKTQRKKTTKQSNAKQQDLDEILLSIEPAKLHKLIKDYNQGKLALSDTLDARELLRALKQYQRGDFSVRLPEQQAGIVGEIAHTFNACVEMQQKMLEQSDALAYSVGEQGQFDVGAWIEGASGGWAEQIASMNGLVDQLTQPISDVTDLLTELSRGVLDRVCPTTYADIPLKGELKALPDATNKLIVRLQAFMQQLASVAAAAETGESIEKPTRAAMGAYRDALNALYKGNKYTHDQLRSIEQVLQGMAKGQRQEAIKLDKQRMLAGLQAPINELNEQLEQLHERVQWVANCVNDGKFNEIAPDYHAPGNWGKSNRALAQGVAKIHEQIDDVSNVLNGLLLGQFDVQAQVSAKGQMLKLKKQLNQVVMQLNELCQEVSSNCQQISDSGVFTSVTIPANARGKWHACLDALQTMIHEVNQQLNFNTDCVNALLKGQFSLEDKTQTKGEFDRLRQALFSLTEQLTCIIRETQQSDKRLIEKGDIESQLEIADLVGDWLPMIASHNRVRQVLQQQASELTEKIEALHAGDFNLLTQMPTHSCMVQVQNAVYQFARESEQLLTQLAKLAEQGLERGFGYDKLGTTTLEGIWEQVRLAYNELFARLQQQITQLQKISIGLVRGEFGNDGKDYQYAGDFIGLAKDLHIVVRQSKLITEQFACQQQQLQKQEQLLVDLPRLEAIELTGEWLTVFATHNEVVRRLREGAKLYDAMERNYVNANDSYLQLTAEYERYQTMYRGLQDDYKGVLANLGQLQTELNEARAIKEVAELKMQHATQVQETLQYATNSIEKEKQELISQLRAVQQEVEQVQGSYRELDNSYVSALTRIQQLEQDKEGLQKMNDAIAASTEQLQQQLVMSEQEIQSLTEQQLRVSDESGQLQMRLHTVEKNKLDIEQKYAELQATITNLTTNCSELQAQKQELILSAETAALTKAELLENLEQVQKQLVQVKQEKDDIVRLKQEVVANKHALQQETETLQEEIASLVQQATTWQKKEAQLKHELQQYTDKVTAANEEKFKAEQQLSDLQSAGQMLDLQLQQAAVQVQQQQQLMADLVESFKKPVNSTKILAKALCNNVHNHLDSKEMQFADKIYQHNSSIAVVLADILELSQLQKQLPVAPITRIKIHEQIEALRMSFTPNVLAKGLKLIFKIDDAVPSAVLLDSDLLQQLLTKLLHTAINHTQYGGITLVVKLATSGWSEQIATLATADKVISIVVADTGSGMSSEQQTQAVAPFTQGFTALGDVGLSLLIAKQLAERLGGELKISSVPERGSVFTVFLPLVLSSAGVVKVANTTLANADLV